MNEKDTVHGFIDYRGFKTNARVCYFKKNREAERLKFTPADISGYMFDNGRFYVSKAIQRDSIFFLEFLVQGKANLYFMDDRTERFFIEKDSVLTELKNTVELSEINGTSYLKNHYEYKGLLNFLFADADISNEIQSSTLQQGSMIKLTKDYHEKVCKDSGCILYRKSFHRTKVNIGLVYGINSSILNLSSNTMNQSMGLNYSTASNSFAGLSFNFHNMPLIHERYSINIELLSTRFNYILNDYSSPRKHYIKLPITLQYRVLTGKTYPTLEAGIIDDIISYNQQHFTYTAGGRINFNYFKDFGVFVGCRFEELHRFSFSSGLYF